MCELLYIYLIYLSRSLANRDELLPIYLSIYLSRSLANRGELLPIYEKAKEKTAALDQMKKQKKAAN